jgi:hypothetical protein
MEAVGSKLKLHHFLLNHIEPHYAGQIGIQTSLLLLFPSRFASTTQAVWRSATEHFERFPFLYAKTLPDWLNI